MKTLGFHADPDFTYTAKNEDNWDLVTINKWSDELYTVTVVNYDLLTGTYHTLAQLSYDQAGVLNVLAQEFNKSLTYSIEIADEHLFTTGQDLWVYKTSIIVNSHEVFITYNIKTLEYKIHLYAADVISLIA